MLGDLFWNAATSDWSLAFWAAIALAAIVVSHVPLIQWIPTIGSYVKLAGAIGYLALSMLFLFVGFRLADERSTTRRLQTDLHWTEMQLENQKAAAADKERLAAEKTAEADDLKTQVDDYATRLANRPVTPSGGNCDALDDDDLDGLRSLRRRAIQHKRADPAGLRGSGGASSAPGP